MKKIIPFCLAAMLLSSCAMMFNGSYTPVKVHAKPGEMVTFTSDSGVVDTGKLLSAGVHEFSALRGKYPIAVEIKGDTGSQNFLLRATDSWVYYLNLFQPYCIGMIVDLFTPKRYSYPAHVYPNPARTKGYRKGYETIAPPKKSDISITFVPPLISAYLLQPVEYSFSGNVLGSGIGANYSYADKSFLSAECVAATAWITYREPYYANSNNATRKENLLWVALSARHHHILGRFDIGYGVALTWQNCNERFDYGSVSADRNYGLVREDNFFTAGGSFSANYRISRAFYAGVNYQPQLLSFTRNGAALVGSHAFCTGFFWRIPLSTNSLREASPAL